MGASKPRKGDASEEDIKKASQLEGQVMPIKGIERKRLRAMEVTDDLKNFKAFNLFVNPEPSHDYGELEPRRLRKLKPTICQNLRNKLSVVVCTYITAKYNIYNDTSK